MQDGRDGTVRVVGHVARNASWVISFFLKKNRSIGDKTNHGAGLGLEIPCIYMF